MASYECGLCGHIYDEALEGVAWEDLGDDWTCPVCGSPKSDSTLMKREEAAEAAPPVPESTATADYLGEWQRPGDDLEVHMADIHHMATTGESIIEPMRTTVPAFSWEDVLIKGAQLAKIPLNEGDPVNTQMLPTAPASVRTSSSSSRQMPRFRFGVCGAMFESRNVSDIALSLRLNAAAGAICPRSYPLPS